MCCAWQAARAAMICYASGFSPAISCGPEPAMRHVLRPLGGSSGTGRSSSCHSPGRSQKTCMDSKFLSRHSNLPRTPCGSRAAISSAILRYTYSLCASKTHWNISASPRGVKSRWAAPARWSNCSTSRVSSSSTSSRASYVRLSS